MLTRCLTTLATIKEAAEREIEMAIELEAKAIQEEFFDSQDNEQLQRLKFSIKESADLIRKGVEIQPALTAPENFDFQIRLLGSMFRRWR